MGNVLATGCPAAPTLSCGPTSRLRKGQGTGIKDAAVSHAVRIGQVIAVGQGNHDGVVAVIAAEQYAAPAS